MEQSPIISEQFLIICLWSMAVSVVIILFLEPMIKAIKFAVAVIDIIIFHKILKR